ARAWSWQLSLEGWGLGFAPARQVRLSTCEARVPHPGTDTGERDHTARSFSPVACQPRSRAPPSELHRRGQISESKMNSRKAADQFCVSQPELLILQKSRRPAPAFTSQFFCARSSARTLSSEIAQPTPGVPAFGS